MFSKKDLSFTLRTVWDWNINFNTKTLITFVVCIIWNTSGKCTLSSLMHMKNWLLALNDNCSYPVRSDTSYFSQHSVQMNKSLTKLKVNSYLLPFCHYDQNIFKYAIFLKSLKTLKWKYYDVCFIDGEIDPQRKQITCQHSTASKWIFIWIIQTPKFSLDSLGHAHGS